MHTIAVVHDFDLAEDKSQFVYVSFEDPHGAPLCGRFRLSSRFTAVVPIPRISQAISWFLSPSHPKPVFSSIPFPSILRRSFAPFPRPSTPSLRFRSRGNLQELLEIDRPAGWKPRTRGIYANNWGNYVSTGPRVTLLFGLQSAGEIMLRTVCDFLPSPLSSRLGES